MDPVGAEPRASVASEFSNLPLARATPGRGLEQMWFSLTQLAWKSIVLVPIDPSPAPAIAMSTLATMVEYYDLGRFRCVDARTSALADGVKLAQDMAAGERDRWVVAVGAPALSAGAVPIMLHAEAAVLFVRLGFTRLESARDVINIIGRERVLGVVSMR